jgi:6-phosphofructokinase 2
MAQIITLTLNPCVDKSTSVSALMPEKKLRCADPKFEPGGGGLNVAKAIHRLGGEALAVYPAGGHSGSLLRALMDGEGLRSLVIPARGITRENMHVVDNTTNYQYRFTMPGPTLEADEWKACLAALKDQKQAQFIVVSGSLPKGLSPGIFHELSALSREMNARLVVDTSGDALKEAAAAGAYLLKPNLGELCSLAGYDEVNEEDAERVAREIIQSGKCEVLIISMGPTGALLVSENETVRVVPPAVKRRSTVGAGDSMVAGVVYSLSKGKSMKETLMYGVACGTAATINPGTDLCHLPDVENLYRLISRING